MKIRVVAIVVASLFPLGALAQGAGADARGTASKGSDAASGGVRGSPGVGVQGGVGSSDSASGSAHGGVEAQRSTFGKGTPDADSRNRPRPKTPEELRGNAPDSTSGQLGAGAAGEASGTTRN
jgi:hypothetical protein